MVLVTVILSAEDGYCCSYRTPFIEDPVISIFREEEYLGSYELTAYCGCSYCCGKSDGITASGTVATAGRTVASNSIPLGTHILINDVEYIVEDTGGMGSNVIDIYFNSHQEALEFGRQKGEVYIIKWYCNIWHIIYNNKKGE